MRYLKSAIENYQREFQTQTDIISNYKHRCEFSSGHWLFFRVAFMFALIFVLFLSTNLKEKIDFEWQNSGNNYYSFFFVSFFIMISVYRYRSTKLTVQFSGFFHVCLSFSIANSIAFHAFLYLNSNISDRAMSQFQLVIFLQVFIVVFEFVFNYTYLTLNLSWKIVIFFYLITVVYTFVYSSIFGFFSDWNKGNIIGFFVIHLVSFLIVWFTTYHLQKFKFEFIKLEINSSKGSHHTTTSLPKILSTDINIF